MKKLFILLIIAMIGLSSCTESTLEQDKNIPSKVVEMKEANAFDTILVLKDTSYTYQFTMQKKYIGAISNDSPNMAQTILSCLLFFVVILIFIIACS